MTDEIVHDAMIIDDTHMDYYLTKRQVLDTKMTVGEPTIYTDARVALDYIQNHEVTKNIRTFLFLDIQMPGMDGREFMVEFNKLPPETKAAYDIIVNSSALTEELKNFFVAYESVKEVVVKEYNLQKFKHMLEHIKQKAHQDP